MKLRSKLSFTTITTEGSILPADLLDRIADLTAPLDGRTDSAYHLSPGERLNEAFTRSWNRALAAWGHFEKSRALIAEGDIGTTITRERWLLPLFAELGYGRLVPEKSVEVSGRSFAVSHGWSQTPIHLVGFGVGLDTRTAGVAGASRTSPHGLVQELLNASDDRLWGFVSNGLKIRILRDNSSLTRQAFVEFDLDAMMTGEAFADFALLWLLCHQSSVEGERPEDCRLEKWSKIAGVEGTRALDLLRKGVEEAIEALGRGFLKHPANRSLRGKLQTGELTGQDYYRQTLRLVYRLLFLFVAEDRDLLLVPEASIEARNLYFRFYSVSHLRDLAIKRVGTRHTDLYSCLQLIMTKLGTSGCRELGLPALGSFLWSQDATKEISDPDLSSEGAALENVDLLMAIRSLGYTKQGDLHRRISYKNLGTEELGSVYESLLERHPILNVDAATFELSTTSGNERKTSGSYYTPSSLVDCLLDTALDPVIDAAARKPNAEEAILELRVCDPACGSGHFLIAAAHRIAKRLATVRTGNNEPAPTEIRHAIREVIGHCIYGVDINPMTVELCKVALWMEALEPGRPLSFLDHHIQCGNSLVGATPALLAKGIPDAAFEPIEGDDRFVCSAYKKRNRDEKKSFSDRQGALNFTEAWDYLGNIPAAMAALETAPDDTPEAIRRMESRYAHLVESSDYRNAWFLADLWCAAFAWKKTSDQPYIITEKLLRDVESNPLSAPDLIIQTTLLLADHYQYFHWHLAFPSVFRVDSSEHIAEKEGPGWNGGFDCMLGNPPWEKFTISDEEWFSGRDAAIGNQKGKSTRDGLILELEASNPSLFIRYNDAKRDEAFFSKFLSRGAGTYPITGFQEINSYHLFVELCLYTTQKSGRVGMVVKTGIGSAENCLPLFTKLVNENRLVSLFDFVNSVPLFPTVQTVERFTLLTYTGGQVQPSPALFATLCREPTDLSIPGRVYVLRSSDLKLMSPLNGACPLLKTGVDAEIMRGVYTRYRILGYQQQTGDAECWLPHYTRIFDMATDSGEFRKLEQLAESGFKFDNSWKAYRGATAYYPLYEGKSIYLLDHRYGSFETVPAAKRYGRKAEAPTPPVSLLQNPSYFPQPRYWYPADLWIDRAERRSLRTDFCFLYRDVAGVYPDLRTAIGAITPSGPAGDKAPCLTLPTTDILEFDAVRGACFAGLFCSLPFDYLVRNKLYSKSFKLNVLSQIPMPGPQSLLTANTASADCCDDLVSAVAQLTYTSHVLDSFGSALGIDEPFIYEPDHRFSLLRKMDAISAYCFGLSRVDLEYVLDSFKTLALNESKPTKYGEFRTKRMVLQYFDQITARSKSRDILSVGQCPLEPAEWRPRRGLVTDALRAVAHW